MSASFRALRLISGPSRRLIGTVNVQSRSLASVSRASRPSSISYTNWLQHKLSTITTVRHYGGGPAPLTRDFVQERIVDTLKACDKVDPAKITPTANLSKDLGLDSLDVVDALFFIEEEFGIEIPDEDANELYSVDQIVDYILAQPDAF